MRQERKPEQDGRAEMREGWWCGEEKRKEMTSPPVQSEDNWVFRNAEVDRSHIFLLTQHLLGRLASTIHQLPFVFCLRVCLCVSLCLWKLSVKTHYWYYTIYTAGALFFCFNPTEQPWENVKSLTWQVPHCFNPSRVSINSPWIMEGGLCSSFAVCICKYPLPTQHSSKPIGCTSIKFF